MVVSKVGIIVSPGAKDANKHSARIQRYQGASDPLIVPGQVSESCTRLRHSFSRGDWSTSGRLLGAANYRQCE